MHEILLGNRAERDLRRLPETTFGRVIRKIKALAEKPRPPDCRKLMGSVNDYRIRVGDYRILYEVDDRERVVRILRIRHRRDVYQ